MISIASTAFDLQGTISFNQLPSDAKPSLSRRVSRAATLDQGVSVSDRGYSDGDRTFTYFYKPISKEHDDRARRIIKLHPTVTVSTEEGVFLAAPESFSPSPEQNTFTLLVIRKISED